MEVRIESGNNGTGKAIDTLLRGLSGFLLLWCVATGAHAASIYRCVGAGGPVTFRDTPCQRHAQQTKLDVSGQPLIDPDAPRHATTPRTSRHSARPPRSRATASSHRHKQPMSWECRAADGEVFYRHSRCPGSVPGDGVVRIDYASARSRGRHTPWDRVHVHGVKVTRAEACRRIHSAGAAGRDGHQRDEHVSTYDHLMGRDPCASN